MKDDSFKGSIFAFMLPIMHGQKSFNPDAQLSYNETELVMQSARTLRAFVDELPCGFFVYEANEHGEILFVNKALLSIFKCETLAELRAATGNSFLGMVHEDDRERVLGELASHTGDNVLSDNIEYRIMRKDGVVRWIEDYGHILHDESDSKFYYAFVVDATEKIARRIIDPSAPISNKQEKEQLLQMLIEEYDKERRIIRQEHLQRLEVIEGLSINYDSILYADIDGDFILPYRLSVRLERQFEKKLQVRALRWFLSDYADVWVHPEDRQYVIDHTSPEFIKRKLKEEPTYYINYRCIRNGEVEYIQWRFVNVGSGPEVSQIVIGYRNVDKEVLQEMEEKKLFQAALNKAKLADVAKNTFLSNMSHDMRTPLNAIFGYIELAQKNLDNNKVVESYLNKIKKASVQILDLVDKVLEISYAESQDFSLMEVPCAMSEIIERAIASVRDDAEQKHISLELATKIEHDDIIADSDKLIRVLSHILDNAVKYTASGGRVKISATEKTSNTQEFSSFVIAISDTGIGIAKNAIARIFDPFERINNTTKSEVFGTGLGLTIAKQLMESMGGNIKAESVVGHGSTFTVSVGLRLRDEKKSAAPICAETLKGRRILIVEDNEINLEIEREILSDLGFNIDTAENGKIAVEKIRASSPGDYALVLMDIQMPVMDGRQAAAAIRNLPDPALAQIPIIALSANAFESDKRESLRVGMNAHISKPLDVDMLFQAINTSLNGMSV